MQKAPTESPTARLEAVFDAHEGQVRAYARRRVSLADDVEDIVAETFAVAWRRIDDLPREPLPWLYGTARRVIANHRRSARRRSALVDAVVADASRGPHEPALTTGLLEALATLSEDDREALLLVAWEGFGHRQAAQACGCSLAAFAARHGRARRRLARALDSESRPSSLAKPSAPEEAS